MDDVAGFDLTTETAQMGTFCHTRKIEVFQQWIL